MQLLRGLAHHAVVPIVLRDPAEVDAVHRRGIAVLRDLESGERRFVWLRPRLIEAMRARRAAREAHCSHACRRAGFAPFFVRGRFDPAALTRHFLEAQAMIRALARNLPSAPIVRAGAGHARLT